FVNATEAEEQLSLHGDSWMRAERITFSEPVARMVRKWGVLNRPTFEQMCGDADWLYLPADAYIPTRHTKLAATIHDVYKLERPVPGENRWDHYKARWRHWIIYKRLAVGADAILTVSQFSADRI